MVLTGVTGWLSILDGYPKQQLIKGVSPEAQHTSVWAHVYLNVWGIALFQWECSLWPVITNHQSYGCHAVLGGAPLSINHAYKAGYSCDSKNWGGDSTKRNTLVAFLDIEGAFGSTPTTSMMTALKDHMIPHSIIHWIGATLKHRVVTAKVGLCRESRQVGQETILQHAH